jgi:hypothetical protein
VNISTNIFFFGQFLRPIIVDPGGLKIDKFLFFPIILLSLSSNIGLFEHFFYGSVLR